MKRGLVLLAPSLALAVLGLSHGCGGTSATSGVDGGLDATAPNDGQGNDSTGESQGASDSQAPSDSQAAPDDGSDLYYEDAYCPVCAGSNPGSCDCPCSPPPTGGLCSPSNCDYGGGTTTSCSEPGGYVVCSGPACPPSLCALEAGSVLGWICCRAGGGGQQVVCEGGAFTCLGDDGGTVCQSNSCPCPDAGSDAAGE